MNGDDPLKVFLSSTFSDLERERSKVQEVIQRMSGTSLGMESFGSFSEVPLEYCRQQVRRADVVILALAHRYGFVPRRASRSITHQEYLEARKSKIPILAYFAEGPAYPPAGIPDARLARLKEEVRDRHGVSWFSSAEHLASQVAADLAREASRIRPESYPVEEEADRSLICKHLGVLAAMRRGDFDGALALNRDILREHERSPRANYNQACILSRLAGGARGPRERERLLEDAERHFRLAFNCGIVNLLRIHSKRKNPYKIIIGDADLAELYAARGEFLGHLLREDEQKLWLHEGGGCVEAGMRVALPGGGERAIGEVREGEAVASWDLDRDAPAAGRVAGRRTFRIGEAIRINNSLILSPSHPVLTSEGWLAAASVRVGTMLRTLSPRPQVVTSVERLRGDFAVVDLSVAPFPIFAANSILVHNDEKV